MVNLSMGGLYSISQLQGRRQLMSNVVGNHEKWHDDWSVRRAGGALCCSGGSRGYFSGQENAATCASEAGAWQRWRRQRWRRHRTLRAEAGGESPPPTILRHAMQLVLSTEPGS